jgi:hypothetical protein
MTTTTTKKSAADLAFERKVARIAKALDRLNSECFGLVAESRELCLADEQIGGIMTARETLMKAARRFRDSAKHVKENI